MLRDTPSLDVVIGHVGEMYIRGRGEDCGEEDTKIVSYRFVMHDSKGRRDCRASFANIVAGHCSYRLFLLVDGKN